MTPTVKEIDYQPSFSGTLSNSCGYERCSNIKLETVIENILSKYDTQTIDGKNETFHDLPKDINNINDIGQIIETLYEKYGIQSRLYSKFTIQTFKGANPTPNIFETIRGIKPIIDTLGLYEFLDEQYSLLRLVEPTIQ